MSIELRFYDEMLYHGNRSNEFVYLSPMDYLLIYSWFENEHAHLELNKNKGKRIYELERSDFTNVRNTIRPNLENIYNFLNLNSFILRAKPGR